MKTSVDTLRDHDDGSKVRGRHRTAARGPWDDEENGRLAMARSSKAAETATPIPWAAPGYRHGCSADLETWISDGGSVAAGSDGAVTVPAGELSSGRFLRIVVR
ncbi:MAG: hypothetical protein WCP53_13295 [Verrucomicrobiota bacterium]